MVDGKGIGEGLGEVLGVVVIIRIYCINIFFN